MRSENVEILSDKTNAAVMRHAGRAFPGVRRVHPCTHGSDARLPRRNRHDTLRAYGVCSWPLWAGPLKA
ncbi:DUF6959 family protein [Mesorhizobium sp. M8A.F.Ca.ET.182.01.1.1]|uniref:DUF6959 family protein n=1 Tax=Mesorhizobium sp. M8A.F.Ca.ET.182.01.1.1 TaxID=2563964 RepID=UPI003FA58646